MAPKTNIITCDHCGKRINGEYVVSRGKWYHETCWEKVKAEKPAGGKRRHADAWSMDDFGIFHHAPTGAMVLRDKDSLYKRMMWYAHFPGEMGSGRTFNFRSDAQKYVEEQAASVPDGANGATQEAARRSPGSTTPSSAPTRRAARPAAARSSSDRRRGPSTPGTRGSAGARTASRCLGDGDSVWRCE